MLKIVSIKRLVAVATIGAVAFLMALSVVAQSPRRPRSRSAAPKPRATPAPIAQPPATPASEALAIANGQTITAADIEPEVRAIISQDADPHLRAFFEDPEKETAEARRRALDARINSLLIATEAKKQRKTLEDFRELEIESRISPPTEEEIAAVYEANRRAFGDATLDSVRPQIINYLRTRRAEEVYAHLANRLRMTNLVTRGADVNAANLQPATVLATVAGTPINAGALNERMKAYEFKLRLRIHEIRKSIVDRKVNDLLLIAEAKKRNIAPEEIVRAEITNQLKPPSEAEIKKFYDENRAQIKGDLASSRAVISKHLEDQEQANLERLLSERVRAGANFRIMLPEPEPPVQSISADDDPSRGDQNAPVRVVEFTDFQCSACGAMYPLLEEVLKSYEKSVYFVVRDFPLAMHPHARKAAEAAAAAHAQGKFFDYADLLFKNQNALEVPALKKYASDLGLDRKRFDTELDNGTYAAEVQHDVEEGEAYGIEGTPTIYINGVMLREFTAEGIRSAINRALAQKTQASQR